MSKSSPRLASPLKSNEEKKEIQARLARTHNLQALFREMAAQQKEVLDTAGANSLNGDDATIAAAGGGAHGSIAAANRNQKPVGGLLLQHRMASQAVLTSSGRPIVLSAESRQLPLVFRDQRRTVQNIESTLGSVAQTIRYLNFGFEHSEDRRLPRETEQALEENELQFQHVLQEAAEKRKHRSLALQNDEDSMYNADWWTRVQRARVAAADEGIGDEQSVSDYTEDVEVPKLVKDRTMRVEVTNMRDAITKIAECAATMSQLEQDTETKWWSSAIRTREIKVASIRANFHARHALQWCLRAREHLLMQIAYLNFESERSRKDLVQLQQQIADFTNRTAESEASTRAINIAVGELQDKLSSATEWRQQLQSELVSAAHELKLICDNAFDIDDVDSIFAFGSSDGSPGLGASSSDGGCGGDGGGASSAKNNQAAGSFRALRHRITKDSRGGMSRVRSSNKFHGAAGSTVGGFDVDGQRSDPLVAELALLMHHTTWPEKLREDVERVMEWIGTTLCVLE